MRALWVKALEQVPQIKVNVWLLALNILSIMGRQMHKLTRAVGSKASDGPKEKGSHLNWRISGKASLHLS